MIIYLAGGVTGNLIKEWQTFMRKTWQVWAQN